MRSVILLGLAASLTAILPACAGTECNFHSQCDRLHYCSEGHCLQDCQRDYDCDPGQVCTVIGRCEGPDGDAGTPMDAGRDAAPPPEDGGPPPVDAGPPPADAGPGDGGSPPPDSGPPPADSGGGTGAYLDRCGGDGDCASGRCVDDLGGTQFCTRACSGHAECAHEHVCDGSVCVPDDTGQPCSTATPASCNLGLCLGPSGGTGACTRPCSGAADCPAGYACTEQGGMRVCVDIEKPCSGASDCLSGLCLSLQGCTATCRTAADCPRRLAGLPPYTCEVAFGSSSPICVPPSDIVGNQAAGEICDYDPGTGFVLCRSGACNDAAAGGPMCTQACTEEGGCGPGLGCFPEVDGTETVLVCARAGSRDLGEACTSGRQCRSGLCDATGGRCTRLCGDGLCPTGWSCDPVAGFSVALCRP